MSDNPKKPGFFQRLFGIEKPQDDSVSKDDAADKDDAAPHEDPGRQHESASQAESAAQDDSVSQDGSGSQDNSAREEATRPEDAPKPDRQTSLAPEQNAPDRNASSEPPLSSEPAPAKPSPQKAQEPQELTQEHEPAGQPPRPQPDQTAASEPDADELTHSDPGPPQTTPEWIAAHPEGGIEPQPGQPDAQSATAKSPKSWFQRLSTGLKRSSDQLSGSISSIFTKRKLDAETLEELEDTLIAADLGADTAMAITEALAKDRFDKQISQADVRQVLASEISNVLAPVAKPLDVTAGQTPFVILMVGVNGSGKTTTIGKLAQKLQRDGKSVLLAAGDTFRAAAIEQLQVWGTRTGVPVVTRPPGADASGLAYDAVTQAIEEKRDVLIIDTAGRLQNREELMAELEKIIRVITKVLPGAPHATLLTLDATTGQNALRQVEIFGQRAHVTGLVMTKLDGTARGGILVAIAKKFGLPVHFIGVGEGVDDLEPFTAADFAAALAGKETQ